MKTQELRGITKYAICSRILIILLQYVANLVIPDHDAQVFISPIKEELNSTDQIIHHALGGFLRWDSQYFLHIAKYGYTFENTIAFFPLFPLIVRYISMAVLYVLDFVNFSSIFLLVSVSYNIFLFQQTAWTLYEISSLLFTPNIVYATLMMFFFNPSSIFFSAPYSEGLYCYLTLKSVLSCLRYAKKYVKKPFTYVNLECLNCISFISLSMCTRSNGVLNMGFFVYFYIMIVMDNFNSSKKAFIVKYLFLITSASVLLFYIAVMMIPFVFIQIYDYINYCRDFTNNVPDFLQEYAKKNNFVLPGTFSTHNQSWCYDDVPLAYSYVQKKYWNVGLLQYFEMKQIPNFLLAMPVIVIVLKRSLSYFKANKAFLIHLGIFQKQYYLLRYKDIGKNNFKKTEFDITENIKFVCVVHIFLLTVFCVFFIHIQVTTRMIFSATPCIYWFCAQYYINPKTSKFIQVYCLAYFIIGTVLFSNYLPWT